MGINVYFFYRFTYLSNLVQKRKGGENVNLSKRISACLIALTMGLGYVPEIVFATEPTTNSQQDTSLHYEMSQEINEGQTQSTISLKFSNAENLQVEKVILPDGTEYTQDLMNVTYVVTENGQYEFKVDYFANGIKQNLALPVQVTALNKSQDDLAHENSLVQYETSQEINAEKTESTICLTIEQPNTVQLVKVVFPDGTEKTADFSNVTYTATKNGQCNFTVVYLMDGIEHNEIIPVEVTELANQAQVVANDELNTKIELKGATYFDGDPFWGTKQKMVSRENAEVPYNGWQLMQLTVKIPYQDGLNIKSITPSAASEYPELSIIEKDDTESLWTYDFYFYDNGTYEFTINYSLNGTDKVASVSHTVEGLVSIKDVSMRRHLINTYGDYSNVEGYNTGQYITKDILATTLIDPWGHISFDFGKDGDGGSTAQYTTSLDGLQYLTNIHGMYLFKCQNLAAGETIEPITNTYYPNMKILRISEIFNSRPNLPEGSYTPEMIAQAISHMPNLSELSMCYTGFVDLPVIAQLNGQLDTLEADHCAIESVEGFEKHPNIQMISLAFNKIRSIQPFENANLSNVIFLDLGRNQIFDLRPLYKTLNPNIVGGQRFGANKQTIQFEQTVIANLNDDQYQIELPMPIDIDGSLTDAVEAAVGFADGTQKNYIPVKKEGKTYIFIPKADVDSTAENPFNNMKFAFTFNNKNGVDTRTKGGYSGTVNFKVSPFATKYGVVYDFVSGTRGKSLPTEVTDLLPIDPTQYEEGQMVNAIQPGQTTVTVGDGVWTFKGYDANSKLANDANVNENGDIPFTGTWTFTKTEPPVTKKYSVDYDFISGTTNQELPQEVVALLPVDPTQYEEGQTVNAIQPQQTSVTVEGGTWTFEGYDANSKLANDANVNENGDIPFTGTWTFTKTEPPVTKKYPVDYDFVSGTTDQELPQEVLDLLPNDPNQYYEGQTINAIQPQQTTVTVADGTWTFDKYDANSKIANADQANENGVIQFVGTWTFTKTQMPDEELFEDIYEFDSGTPGKELPEEVLDLLPVDSKQYEEGQIINAIRPAQTTVIVDDGVWVFEGYDANKKEADMDNLEEDGLIHFTGTWTFYESEDPDKPVDPDKPSNPDKPINPDKPVDPNKPTNPDKPTEPSKPVNPNQSQSNKPNKPGSVDTGRRTNLLISSLLLLVSAASTLGVCLKLHKSNDEIQ